jgi:CheY-like chemotaxis protein
MSPERVRILLVEDNAADIYRFRKAVDSAARDCELTVIEDGREALAFVRAEGRHAARAVPDIAVLDLNIPRNVQVLRAIRGNERLTHIPVILTSSAPSSPLDETTEPSPVTRYIRKPPDLEDFLRIGAVLKDILRESQAQPPAAACKASLMANPTTKPGAGPETAVRILVVEDNAGDVYLLEKALQQRQIRYELIRYIDGEQAIRALAKDDCVAPISSFSTSICRAVKGSRCSAPFGANPRWLGCPSAC